MNMYFFRSCKRILTLTTCSFLVLGFLMFFISCNGSDNDIDAEEMTKEEMKSAIALILNSIKRTDDNATLESFVVEGESRIPDENDKSKMVKESSISVKFDGENKFYRKDIFSYDGENMTSESWCEYVKDNDDHWSETRKVEEIYNKESRPESNVDNLFEYLDLTDSEYEALSVNDDLIYKLERANETIELGFKDKKLTYCLYHHDLDESNPLEDGITYEYVLEFKNYGSKISINIPE